MAKLMLISLDLLLALPVAAVSSLLLFSIIESSGAYIYGTANYQTKLLHLYSSSQAVASMLCNANLSYGNASRAVSSYYNSGVISRLAFANSFSYCTDRLTLCRFVVISGKNYILVTYYENANIS